MGRSKLYGTMDSDTHLRQLKMGGQKYPTRMTTKINSDSKFGSDLSVEVIGNYSKESEEAEFYISVSKELWKNTTINGISLYELIMAENKPQPAHLPKVKKNVFGKSKNTALSSFL